MTQKINEVGSTYNKICVPERDCEVGFWLRWGPAIPWVAHWCVYHYWWGGWVLFFISFSLQILHSCTHPHMSIPTCSLQPWVVFCPPWLLRFTPSTCKAVSITFTATTSDKTCLGLYSATANPTVSTVSSTGFLCPPTFLSRWERHILHCICFKHFPASFL